MEFIISNFAKIFWGLIGATVVFVVVRFRNEIAKFIIETRAELIKVSWSTRNELLESTWIVIISSVVLGVYIGVIDFALSKFLGIMIR